MYKKYNWGTSRGKGRGRILCKANKFSVQVSAKCCSHQKDGKAPFLWEELLWNSLQKMGTQEWRQLQSSWGHVPAIPMK